MYTVERVLLVMAQFFLITWTPALLVTVVRGEKYWGSATIPALAILVALTVAAIIYDVKLVIGALRDRKAAAETRAYWARKRAEQEVA